MANVNNPPIAEFIALFNQKARYHHRHEVLMAAWTVHNQAAFSQSLAASILVWLSGMSVQISIGWGNC